MCRCLRIQPSGFYAWQKSPLSTRAQEDARQTELIRQAWNDSGKVYGYRKLHDDLLDRDCQDFRVWPGIMGNKESHYVTTQRTCHTE
jgi:hypothetical protein